MRNIVEYPITAVEVIDTLENIESDPQIIGNLTPFIKQGLLKFFEDPENMNKILEQLKV